MLFLIELSKEVETEDERGFFQFDLFDTHRTEAKPLLTRAKYTNRINPYIEKSCYFINIFC